ncbi:alanyl-tRNA editing protein AlaXM [Pyrobaculum aerophilum]|uniref:Alanyl-tRNA synthetase related protein n=2 Tax=Pyrobaculum aerophilum TaxID=13773 RepID=Q8ZVE9_PYRAE|nr:MULTISPECIES: alanyl-tRNA editing protein AlaXM [Pyrobaculum]AAL64107.1 alanyl-tRNA synthetase related protein [Pyrobaculum aerophilum str. IM2]MCX8135856.1 alanyl-tRNA editing protein AlaXM [Pyrobaculum aerophilum]HII47129.1 alanyl-tRNA editing protein [Pyrobaculum aerophilum]
MRTKLLYQEDSYIREFEATVLEVNGNEVILDRTAFHDGTGGVQADSGYIIFGNERYFAAASHKGGEVVHVLDRAPVFKPGDVVRGELDWEKRYKKMRLHTAAHILSAVLYDKYNALITGGEITHEYARDDFNIEGDMATVRKAFEEAVAVVNEIAQRGIEIKVYWLPREEALKIPGVVKLAERMPPDIPRLRIVEIPGVDVQADGGPHVKNTREIGVVKIIKVENRGKGKKRLYYTVE